MLHSPKAILRNSNKPKGVITAVLWMSCRRTGIWWYLLRRSNLEKTQHPTSLVVRSPMLWQVYLSGMVCMLSCLKSPQGLQDPSVFFTMCSGEAQLLLERQMTPCHSISLNSALAALSLAGSSRLYLAATGLQVVSMWC